MSTSMNYLQALAALRAAGALLAAAYDEMLRNAGPITEAQLKAAEDALLKPITALPADTPKPFTKPGTDSTQATGTTSAPARVEHFPGVFYTADPDPTRGDIMEGEAPGGDGNIMGAHMRYVDAGYNVNAFGPINRKWSTRSMYAPIFGRGRSGIWDGSNGHDAIPPQAGYSPAGWPIHYTLDGSGPRNAMGNPTGKVIGTGSLMYDDRAFSNDAEVAAYIKAQETKPQPQPQPTLANMQSQYPTKAALAADAEKFSNVVKLDGWTVPVSSAKFGPALNFYSWSDSTFRTQKQQMELPLPPGDGGQGEIILL